MDNFSLLNNTSEKIATFRFRCGMGPVCGLTLRAAGNMRFRWNETNQLRLQTLTQIADGRVPTPVQLNHTKIVYDVRNPGEMDGKIGDGIITKNPEVMPLVTVADCVPIYLYDNVTGVFGLVHSGWKGTGIAVEAINLAVKNYGAKVENFNVIIGPHIHNCCYIVDKTRADYFAENFTPACVQPLEENVKVDWNNGEGPLYRLSLEKANLAVLLKAGVRDENIRVCTDCTCCNEMYGSNRRETKMSGRPDSFTVQTAFLKMDR